ncbi:hypothetical protein SAMN05444487_12218 [Marininema mesophilum]|uniref:Uncharacterized protein n=1 Tax=Marininema mesophilum TaxID=1048340 RepID=A0A1H3CFV6_9BACL|nr:hypothetical protein SAMN05444487_12218 [Marininema mesophilum]
MIKTASVLADEAVFIKKLFPWMIITGNNGDEKVFSLNLPNTG